VIWDKKLNMFISAVVVIIQMMNYILKY
jgi:hypothetical protein